MTKEDLIFEIKRRCNLWLQNKTISKKNALGCLLGILEQEESQPSLPSNLDEAAEIEQLEDLAISLEETIGTSPHSRDTIVEYFMKARQIQKPITDLEKASEEYRPRNFCFDKEHEYGQFYFSVIKETFKAGAEWMAGQGVTVEGVFKAGDPGYPDVRMGEQYSIEHILRKPDGIEPGDNVIVQIKKSKK